MNTIAVQDDVELIEKTNHWLKQCLVNSAATQKVVQLPAGGTPQTIYRYWEQTRPEFLKNVLFQQVDDVLSGPKSGCFKLFFDEYLPSYRQQFLPLSDSPIAPCPVILGVGPNGHLAFHEPEINFNFNYGCVKLSASTLESLHLSTETWGLSYGAGHFLRSPAVLIIAKGKNKQAIVQKALIEKVPSSPFSYILKQHPNCTLIIDRECLS